jgi:hypothetical protein
MLKFNEALLQYIWQHKLWQPIPLITTSGKKLHILKTGVVNHENGPDFFNASIVLDGIELHGNIEIHIKASDWLKHAHQKDARYDKLILHVVYEHDVKIPQNTQFSVEVLELKNYVLPETLARYHALMSAPDTLACSNQLSNVEEEKINLWLQRLLTERLQEKSKYAEQLFYYYQGNFSQTLYTLLLKAFGFKSNSHAFELMAKQLPVEVVLQYASTPFQLEALFLGMCGLLDEIMLFPYGILLQNEFEALQKKHQLVPLPKHLLTTGAVRPANAPALRLAQLAEFVKQYAFLLEQPQNSDRFLVFKKPPSIRASSFWESHYSLAKKSIADASPILGKASVDSIIINAIAPYLFFYGKKNEQETACEMAISMQDNCAFESNRKTKLFLNATFRKQSASQSQGLVQLFDNYCQHKKCLSCAIGLTILRK